MKVLLLLLSICAVFTLVLSPTTPASERLLIGSNDHLAVSPATLNMNRPQVFISSSGRLISPQPTDPDKLPLWEATQVWLNSEYDNLQQLIDEWHKKYEENPEGGVVKFLNDHLQTYLAESRAVDEIAYINRTMDHGTPVELSVRFDAGKSYLVPPKSVVIVPNGCGPHGMLVAAIWHCTISCGPYDCWEHCELVDCEPYGTGCCWYVSQSAGSPGSEGPSPAIGHQTRLP
jgi:hypothetical protein